MAKKKAGQPADPNTDLNANPQALVTDVVVAPPAQAEPDDFTKKEREYLKEQGLPDGEKTPTGKPKNTLTLPTPRDGYEYRWARPNDPKLGDDDPRSDSEAGLERKGLKRATDAHAKDVGVDVETLGMVLMTRKLPKDDG